MQILSQAEAAVWERTVHIIQPMQIISQAAAAVWAVAASQANALMFTAVDQHGSSR
jgi:hypothetical protein